MNLKSLEDRLKCYGPPAPPPDMGEELVDTVLQRHRRRTRTRLLAAVAAVVLAASALMNIQAERTYREAVRFANGDSAPPPEHVLASASIGSLHIHTMHVIAKGNGDSHE